MNQNLKIALCVVSLVALMALVWILSPLFSKKVETIRNPQIDSLGAVISEIQKVNAQLRIDLNYIDQQRLNDIQSLKHDLSKIKKFTPTSRASYIDSIEVANGLK